MPHESRSSPREIEKYRGRVSGPLLDRIDIHIEVPAVRFNELTSRSTGESSRAIRERVIAARSIQQKRFAGRKISCNARMGSRELKEFCAISEETLQMLKHAMQDMQLSARAYDRILKVARTIADLAGAQKITTDHIGEAIQFRSLDRQLWS
jgi:magnesium chelatase family protein